MSDDVKWLRDEAEGEQRWAKIREQLAAEHQAAGRASDVAVCTSSAALNAARAAMLTRAADALELMERAREAEPLNIRVLNASEDTCPLYIAFVDESDETHAESEAEARRVLAHRPIRTAIGLLGKEVDRG